MFQTIRICLISAKEAMKIGCFPVRPLLYTLAALGIFRAGFQFYWGHHHVCTAIIPLFYFAFNIFLILAVHKREVKTLKWAQRATLAASILSVIPFLLLPVFTASFLASGEWEKWDANDTHVHPEKYGNLTSPDFRFFIGATAGLIVEAGAAFLIAVELFKYFLITRIWRAEHDLGIHTEGFDCP
ncbi:hypothetical protein B9Z55_010651 [Caenorhabditis nigoni]|uniref:Uncharacterized protein n=2 Tax=Caenorhabditis nigoni TaxID=1611254 RepID=A0A2G5UGR4_9PELO|nr:hypothetical protein B9Z55_010651 [Caenorhabditis nigoni]